MTIKILRETENNTFYGVFIPNYAADMLEFMIYETNDYDKAVKCLESLKRENITDRHAYNKSPKKPKFILAGCEI